MARKSDGYSVTMRQDKRTSEYLAFMPAAYRNARDEPYYMAFTLIDGWVEVTPEYATRRTRAASMHPEALKRAVDRDLGYISNLCPRLYGR